MLLDVRNTDKKFNGVYALKDLNFSLDAGEIHGLVGENGAGKSTFIKILGGVYKRDGGSILWDGKELLEEIRPEESRNLGINIIFQDNVLIPAFTGAENICLGRPYPVRRADPVEGNGTGSGGKSRGTRDPAGSEETGLCDDSGTEKMRGDRPGDDERL